jgi:hypothetical protein
VKPKVMHNYGRPSWLVAVTVPAYVRLVIRLRRPK